MLDELDNWTREHWPGAERRLWWAAQDYRTTDAVPYAGPLPRGGGRIWAVTGYDKWGMANAAASALRLTGALLGDPPDWATQLEHHGSRWIAAAEAVREGAAVGAELVSGWARAETSRPDAALAEGEGRVVSEGVHPVAESMVDGVSCRVSGVCTHLGGILSWNDAERSWDCPLHGSRFAPDGTRLEGPALDDLEAR
jgi:nitrite reductase/ring-hydroxylating ferredoxin subunit